MGTPLNYSTGGGARGRMIVDVLVQTNVMVVERKEVVIVTAGWDPVSFAHIIGNKLSVM
jgi:hypothetical protein